MKKSVVLLFAFLFLTGQLLLAHGLSVETELRSPFVTVKANFSHGSDIRDGSVEIFAPEATTLYQKGRTDSKGRFVFLPDKAGAWKVIVDDERGHKKTITLQIEQSFFNAQDGNTEIVKVDESDTLCAHGESYAHEHQEHEHAEIPLVYKIIFGLALIIGITGFFYGVKSKKS